MKFYISPSTQQNNVGPNKYIEETYMNLIADILCPELARHGHAIKRNDRKVDDINVFIRESNTYKPDYHIAIHSNAGGGQGCEVFCYRPKDTTSPGTRMATSIYKKIEAVTPTADRGVKDGSHLGEVGRTTAPSVLMEVDFHDNLAGAQWIMSNYKIIANAILMGILEAIGQKYIAPVVVENKDEIIKNLRLRVETLSAELKTANTDNIAMTADKKSLTSRLAQIKTIASI
jgi:N-acetylmuramoyl-L-alanine amidase